MTSKNPISKFLTNLPNENKCRTFQNRRYLKTSMAHAYGGQHMYISNRPPMDEPDEVTLLAHEIIELVLPKFEMGERLTLEEMNWVVELAELQLNEAYGDPSDDD